MYTESKKSDTGFAMLETEAFRASPEATLALDNVTYHLLDLDDTVVIYKPEFTQAVLSRTFVEHVEGVENTRVAEVAAQLAADRHTGLAKNDALAEFMSEKDIRSFWSRFSTLFADLLQPEDIRFDPAALRFIGLVIQNSMGIGVISNSPEESGNRILDSLEREAGLRLHSMTAFLGDTALRKPKVGALDAYRQQVDPDVQPEDAAYTGNAVSDLVFASRIGSLGIVVDHEGLFANVDSLDDTHQELLRQSIVVNSFRDLQRHLIARNPAYKLVMGFPGSIHAPEDSRFTDSTAINVAPSSANISHLFGAGVAKVMSHVPAILERFQRDFSGSGTFSLLDVPNYRSYFHDITGAIAIPEPHRIDTPLYRNYFNSARYRYEEGQYFSRGVWYYRHFIPELADDPQQQSEVVHQEIRDSLAALEAVNHEPVEDQVENMLRLAIMDNLRGNMQALYLSSINVFRDSVEIKDRPELIALGQELKALYENAVELFYSHMLGLPYDRQAIMAALGSVDATMNRYREYFESSAWPLKFKNPEVEHPLHIAARANELTHQYPETSLLVGLSSGGVELATLAQILFRKKQGRSPQVVNYPISTHHGLNMWQADKRPKKFDVDYLHAIGLQAEQVAGQKVVVCEDNSNSGQTLKTIWEIMAEMGPDQLNFAVLEIDPIRILTHYGQEQIGSSHNIGEAASRPPRPIANYFHPDFIGAVNITDVVIADAGLGKVIAMDTARKRR